MNEDNQNQNINRTNDIANIFIRVTIIMVGFAVILKICKVMVNDLKDMGLK